MRLTTGILTLILCVACGSSPVQRRLGFIEAEPGFLDFGVVTVGQPSTGQFALMNAGSIPVHVQSLEIIEDDGGAFQVESSKFTLEAGETVQVEVTYGPLTPSSNDGAFLKVTSDAANARELLVNLKGRSHPAEMTAPDAGDTEPPPPPPEEEHIPKLLGYGGASTASGTASNAVWGFNPTSGTYSFVDVEAPEGSPGGRYGHAAGWDAAQTQLLVFGGTGLHAADQEVWALDFKTKPATWKKLPTSGDRPTPRHFVGHAFDPVTRSLYVFGGQGTGETSAAAGLYKLDVATGEWTQIQAANEPPQRSNAATLFDPSTGHLFIAGGYNQGAPAGSREFTSVHSLDLRAANPVWTELPSLPKPMFGGVLWLSSAGLQHYGGITGIGVGEVRENHDEVLELSTTTASWTAVPVSGEKPEGRYLSSSAAIGSRRYVFGGGHVRGNESAVGFGELWEFDTATLQWTQLANSDAPQSPGPLMGGILVATE